MNKPNIILISVASTIGIICVLGATLVTVPLGPGGGGSATLPTNPTFGSVTTTGGPPSYVVVGMANGISNSIYSADGSNSLSDFIGGALSQYRTNVSGTVSNNMPGPLSVAALYGLPIVTLAGNVQITNGFLLNTNSTIAKGTWFFFSGDTYTASNGVTGISSSITPSNINLGGFSAGSVIVIGNQFAQSNSIISQSGSNDIAFRSGFQTNNAQFTNGIFWVYDLVKFQSSIGIALQSFATNGFNVLGGGMDITGVVTNESGFFYPTNVSGIGVYTVGTDNSGTGNNLTVAGGSLSACGSNP